jgi:hypothetical protein
MSKGSVPMNEAAGEIPRHGRLNAPMRKAAQASDMS